MKRFRQYLFGAFALLLGSSGIGGIWFYFEIWVPNRTLSQSDWWQHGYQNVQYEKVRTICHKILAHRVGNHHDAFVALETVGNATSIPYLIRALQWQSFPRKPGDLMTCTTGHCLERLRQLTGHNAGYRYKDWKAWWDATGSKLSADAFPLKEKDS